MCTNTGTGLPGGSVYPQSGVTGTSNDAAFSQAPITNTPYDPLMLSQAGGDQSASANMANLSRAQWNDYKSRFAPIENTLFARLNDPAYMSNAVTQAGINMGSAYDSSAQQTARDFSRYGINPSGMVAQEQQRQNAVDKASAVAGARNDMRTAMRDQQMGLMTGGLSTATQKVGQ